MNEFPTIWIALLGIIIIGVLAKFSLSAKKDIINVSETNSRILLATAIIVIISLTSLIDAITAFVFALHLPQQEIYFFFSFLYSIPLVIVIYLLIKTPSIINKMAGEYTPDQELEIYISQLCQKIGIRRKPRIIISAQQNQMPLTGGTLSQRNHLILPSNFDDFIQSIIETATKRGIVQDIPEQKKEGFNSLKEFIILHELAHIKNKDVYYRTYFLLNERLFLTILALWSIFTVLANMLAQNFNIIMPRVVPPAFIIISGVTLFFINRSISKHREYLADARAVLNILDNSKAANQPISTSTKILLPLLQAYEDYRSRIPPLPTPVKMLPFTKMFKTSRTHPEMNERIHAIGEGTFYKPDTPYPPWGTTAWTSIIHVLIMLALMTLGFTIARNIPLMRQLSKPLSFSSESFIRNFNQNESFIRYINHIIRYYAAFVPALISCIVLAIPLRHAHNPTDKQTLHSNIARILLRLGSFCCMTILAYLTVSPFLQSELDVFPAFVFHELSFSIALTCILYFLILLFFLLPSQKKNLSIL